MTLNDFNLRFLTKEDLPFLLEVRNDQSTRNNLENNLFFTLENCKLWFSKLESPWFIILVDNNPVGYIRTNGNEIGCDIHPNHRRKGYAKMAYKKLMQNMSNILTNTMKRLRPFMLQRKLKDQQNKCLLQLKRNY